MTSWTILLLGAALIPAPRPDAPKAEPKLDGNWAIESAELGGQAMPPAFISATTMSIKGDQYTVVVGEAADRGLLKHDPSKAPKSLDITGEEGPNKGKTIRAIYEWAGENLRICYDLSGGPRPTEFRTKSGSQLFLVTYRRK
jgi:uncharacterized protein (TIGR03067 family)